MTGYFENPLDNVAREVELLSWDADSMRLKIQKAGELGWKITFLFQISPTCN